MVDSACDAERTAKEKKRRQKESVMWEVKRNRDVEEQYNAGKKK